MDFTMVSQNYNMEDKSRPCEFHLQNMVLSNQLEWNPNLNAWDVELIYFTLLLRHEEMSKEVNEKIGEEITTLPWVRVEVPKPLTIFTTHNILMDDQHVAPI